MRISLYRRPGQALVGLALIAGLLVASSSILLASTGRANGVPSGALPADAPPQGGVTCRILDPNGDATTQVAAMSFGDLAYWLEFRSSGDLARTVEFRTVPLFQGSPARGQVQRFNTDHSNVVTTPFGVPDWGLDKTSGPWVLSVEDNLGRTAICEFEVVP
jgi:hypothetical protein